MTIRDAIKKPMLNIQNPLRYNNPKYILKQSWIFGVIVKNKNNNY